MRFINLPLKSFAKRIPTAVAGPGNLRSFGNRWMWFYVLRKMVMVRGCSQCCVRFVISLWLPVGFGSEAPLLFAH